ncbi:MAG: hypothetical protein JXK94_15585 [Deltaproteobacteria bacterium]|nr:hypothetical protein [Deltaproteobacteria bacterium]
MIKDLWDIAQSLIGLKKSFADAEREQKDRIATYFEKIGSIIQEAADIFKTGEVPHGKCQQMFEHAQYFIDVVGDTIDKQKAEEFQKKLIESHEVELLASEILGQDESEEKIAELEKIAGSFLTLGSVIRAKK